LGLVLVSTGAFACLLPFMQAMHGMPCATSPQCDGLTSREIQANACDTSIRLSAASIPSPQDVLPAAAALWTTDLLDPPQVEQVVHSGNLTLSGVNPHIPKLYLLNSTLLL
jgi:hypothetical protein